MKTCCNPISIWSKTFVDQFTDYKVPEHLSNLYNPNMNNLMAIDYANVELMGTDSVLPRWTQEFPRLSSDFKSRDQI